MLPDYPGLKTDLRQHLMLFLRDRIQHHLGGLRDIRSVQLFEGSQRLHCLHGDEPQPTDMKEMSSHLEILATDVPTLGLQELMVRFDKLAEDLAGQQARHIYSALNAAVEKHGNTIDAKGERLTAEKLVELLEQMHIDFAPDGTPMLPSIHAHPVMAESIERANEELAASPALQARWNECIREKRRDWDAREASRRLVG